MRIMNVGKGFDPTMCLLHTSARKLSTQYAHHFRDERRRPTANKVVLSRLQYLRIVWRG